MSRIAVLGGGISGLSTAYYLSKLPTLPFQKILVLEASDHIGGWIQTSQFDDGTVFEHGPRSMRKVGKSGINTLQLVEELGLEEDVLSLPRSHPAAKNRFIYAKNQLCALPNGPVGILKKQTPFSKSLLRIGWKEPFRKSIKLHDESIYDFFARRFDKELAEYVADPVCRGIFAGDCRKLSIKSCFPDVFRYEQEHGSIMRGAYKAPRDKTEYSGLVKRSKEEKWAMWTLRHGLKQLPESMMQQISEDDRVEFITNATCQTINFMENKVQIRHGERVDEVDYIVSSILAKQLSPLLPDEHQLLSEQLEKIPAVTVAVVNLEYEDCQLPTQGFGHLVPSCEPSPVLGVIYEHCLFPEHNRSDGKAIRVTCMMGGAWFEELFGNPDSCDLDKMAATAIQAVSDHLGFHSNPSRVIVKLQKDCISQYHVGHSSILDDMATYINDNHLPLSLVGASYKGVSVNDCIYNSKLEVNRICQKYQQ